VATLGATIVLLIKGTLIRREMYKGIRHVSTVVFVVRLAILPLMVVGILLMIQGQLLTYNLHKVHVMYVRLMSHLGYTTLVTFVPIGLLVLSAITLISD
jgi:hypothetical protein